MMTQKPAVSHGPVKRIQENVLAVPERKLLTWLCSQMPRWVTPDRLTATGVFGAIAIFAGYAASGWGVAWLWLSVAGYVLQWFGDSMDGSLARYRRIERPSFGYFIDHSCDGIVTLLILGGMGMSPFVRVDVALFALCGYLLLAIHAFLSARVLGELKLSYGIAGPTEIRFVLLALTFAMMAKGPPLERGAPYLSGFDLVVGGVGVLFVLLFCIQTLITGKKLAAQERSPQR